jgi:hypothetical protein
VITLAAGLMVKYGLHGFTAAYLLNSWFLVAIAASTPAFGPSAPPTTRTPVHPGYGDR